VSRHQEVFASDIEIENLYHVQCFQILLGDQGDGDVKDIDFVLLDEMKQESRGPSNISNRTV